MKSILQKDRVCWMCGANGHRDPLDSHHVFNGAFRKKSEKYGLKVWLCHNSCHEFGPEAVHNNAANMRKLKAWGQEKAMEHYGWTTDQFIQMFGRNYRD